MKKTLVGAFALLLLLAGSALASGHWRIQRLPNMPDGAPAFAVVSPDDRVVTRVECIHSEWVDPDEFAARLLGSTAVMARVIANRGRLQIEDLGPAKFNCAVVLLEAPR
ncbi:hypothetical protein BH11PSE10_BH11PSE10_08320 [soil metagenome]